MSPDPEHAPPSTTIRQAAALMQEHGFRHLPVVDDSRLVGIVSDRDVQPRLLMAHGDPEAVEDVLSTVMSAPVHTVGPEEPITAAARAMVSRQVSALPVVDDGELVGLVTTTDCLLALLDLGGDPAAGGGAG